MVPTRRLTPTPSQLALAFLAPSPPTARTERTHDQDIVRDAAAAHAFLCLSACTVPVLLSLFLVRLLSTSSRCTRRPACPPIPLPPLLLLERPPQL